MNRPFYKNNNYDLRYKKIRMEHKLLIVFVSFTRYSFYYIQL